MEKISWTELVRNEEVLKRVKDGRNIVQTMKKRNADWICHILRRNCLLKLRRRRKDKKEGYKWWEEKEEDVSSCWVTLEKGQNTVN